MLCLGMITSGERMQWGGTVTDPSTITVRGLMNFVLAAGALLAEPSFTTEICTN